MCRQGTLSNEFPVIRENDQDPAGGINNLRALNELMVEDPQDLAATYNPQTSGKGVCGLSHPAKQRTPQLLLQGEEEEDMAYMHAFVGRAVVLWQQVGAQLYEHRGLVKHFRPGILLDMEHVQINRASKGHMR